LLLPAAVGQWKQLRSRYCRLRKPTASAHDHAVSDDNHDAASLLHNDICANHDARANDHQHDHSGPVPTELHLALERND
jgi:hypothetical protein